MAQHPQAQSIAAIGVILWSSCCFCPLNSFSFKVDNHVGAPSLFQEGDRMIRFRRHRAGIQRERLMRLPTSEAPKTLRAQTDDIENIPGREKRQPLAWTIPEGTRFGRLDRLELLPSEDGSQASPETATIATRAIGLNFADIFTILGLHKAANLLRGRSLSGFVPGLEFAGRVVQDPTGTYRTDDRVLGFTRFGAYSERVSVPPVFLIPLPESWTYSEGAAFLVQALTAWHGLVEIGRMPLRGDPRTGCVSDPYVVIVHSAAGGVGLWASELAARRGGIVLGVVGDASKARAFEDRIVASGLSPGSRAMIRGSEKDFGERLARELEGLRPRSDGGDRDAPSLSELARRNAGADLVMESLGGEYFRAGFDSLNDGGALVTFGSTTYSSPGRGGVDLPRLLWRYWNRPRIDPGDLTARNLRLSGFNLIFLTERTAQLRRELSECIACLSGKSLDGLNGQDVPSLEGVTPPLIGEEFDFRTQAIDALSALKSGKTVGKVVMVKNEASN